jgi:hypothetical protein
LRTITAAVQSQIMTAPMPKAVRPTAASIVALPVMTVPENCRSPGPNATQLAIAPKQQKIATAIRWRGRASKWRLRPARKKAPPAQSRIHSGLCKFAGPPVTSNSPAPTSMK